MDSESIFSGGGHRHDLGFLVSKKRRGHESFAGPRPLDGNRVVASLVSLSPPTAWIVDLTAWLQSVDPTAWTFLSSNEQRRIGACLDYDERIRRLVGHLTVRCLASVILGVGWRDVLVDRDRQGKPFIRQAPGLSFNVSHSGQYVLTAFAESPIGVDIERCRPLTDELMHYALTANEYQYVAAEPDARRRAERFLRVWTRKESFFKAMGTGLTGDWRQVSFVSDNRPHQVWHSWHFTEWAIASEYVAVVCSQTPPMPILHYTTAQRLWAALRRTDQVMVPEDAP